MRNLLGLTGALGFVFGCYAFFGADTVLHQIVGMLGFLIAMTGLGAAGIIQAIEKLRADDPARAPAVEPQRYYATPTQPAAVDSMTPIARAHGRAPTDPGI